MQYMGSKRAILKDIIPIILKDRKPGQLFIDLFTGGGNVLNSVSCPAIGYDLDQNTINALITIRDRSKQLPKNAQELTKEEYYKAKNDLNYPYRDYIMFACSFGAKKWGGYGGGKDNCDRIYSQFKAAQNQAILLKNKELYCKDYAQLSFKDCIIYCDPPYKNTKGYGHKFNHDEFWQWCREQSLNNQVFISELAAPEDFKCIWEKQTKTYIKTGKKKPKLEKLFIFNKEK